MKILPVFFVTLMLILGLACGRQNPWGEDPRMIKAFNTDWKFILGDHSDAKNPEFDDASWRMLNLPHDWSIEGMFSAEHPSTPGGGALPGGIGWYRKSFLSDWPADKKVFIEFDGIYQESEVWINGHYLGKRPNGYISFRYELSPYLHQDGTANLLAVRVDNSNQPNSRWYSGSGIYREVRLVVCDAVHVDHWGTFITTPEVGEDKAKVSVQTSIINQGGGRR